MLMMLKLAGCNEGRKGIEDGKSGDVLVHHSLVSGYNPMNAMSITDDEDDEACWT